MLTRRGEKGANKKMKNTKRKILNKRKQKYDKK